MWTVVVWFSSRSFLFSFWVSWSLGWSLALLAIHQSVGSLLRTSPLYLAVLAYVLGQVNCKQVFVLFGLWSNPRRFGQHWSNACCLLLFGFLQTQKSPHAKNLVEAAIYAWWNVVGCGLDDNDYHHTFNNTLKAHLLSSYFSITSKKSSALHAFHQKPGVAVNRNLWYKLPPKTTAIINTQNSL